LALPGRGGDIIEDARTTHDRNGRAEHRRRYHEALSLSKGDLRA